MRRPRRAVAVATLCTALLLGCSGAPERPAAGPDPGPAAAPGTWAERPVVDLRFTVADDLRSVSGWQRIEFTPDLPTCEIVLRAWPNKPITSRAGSALVVSAVRIDGRSADTVDIAAGAPASAPAGTLLEVPLPRCLDAGDRITMELEFDLQLGPDVDERVGTSTVADVAWFATAFPLLAWERGRGWDRGPAVAVAGEMAVSEDFTLDSLEVVAPSGLEVLGTGRPTGVTDGRDGTTVHHFTAPAVRDVAVTVGDLELAERDIDGVRVRVGLDAAVDEADAADWLDQIDASLGDLVDLLGPFPYDDLWVSVLSGQTSGIEFPGAIQFGDVVPDERRGLVTHELAHMWFYGLVGNDQGADPWLDESFATFAQMVADGNEVSLSRPESGDGPPVGAPMTDWAELRRPSSRYYDAVYTLGGAALVEARDRAGHDAFDAALVDYLQTNAFTIATPGDVREAFAGLPEVLEVLREVGALP